MGRNSEAYCADFDAERRIAPGYFTLRATLAWTIGATLCGCVGETKQQALGYCRMEFSARSQTAPGNMFVLHCMESRGFKFEWTPGCTATAPILECFAPATRENKIRAFIE